MSQINWGDIAKGNQRAYTEAYTFYFIKLFNYGRKFTEDESLIEDTIQETLIILWNHREKLPSIQSPQSYLFYSFRNALLYKLKQQKKRNKKEGAVETEPEFHAEYIIIQSETEDEVKKKLEKVIQMLPSRQREALFLRFYEKLSYEEMADVMKISLHAIGMETSPLKDFDLTNIKISADHAGEIKYAKDWQFKEVNIQAKDNSQVKVEDAGNVKL